MITVSGRLGRSLVVAPLAAVLLVGCGVEPPPTTSPQALISEGTLGPAAGPGPARSYDPALAPAGAVMRAELAPFGGGTRTTLTVRGLAPNRGYAAHGHVRPCGPTGDAAGPHFQQDPDPVPIAGEASTDPAYANPMNEYWLDVRTDATGAGTVTTQLPFSIGNRGPESIVLHDGMATMTGPGAAGTAGGRIACLTLES